MRRILQYWQVIVVAIAPLGVYLVPRDRLFDEGHTICLWHNLMGHDCWGCGMTRALASACYFDFAAAWHYHKAVIVVAPLLAWLWAKWLVRMWRAVNSEKQ